MHIPNFRGVFMKDQLPNQPNKYERGIINLDDNNRIGTHWCAYIKDNNNLFWFDSFGNISPPIEILKYCKNCLIFYNFDKFQTFGTTNCGKLCLQFLSTYKIY